MTARRKSFPKNLRALYEQYRQGAQAEGFVTRSGFPGVTNRRVLFSATTGGVERRFHATKGWRVQRVATA